MSKLSCGLHISSKQRQWYRSECSPPPPGWSVSCTWHTISGEPLRHRELLSGITGSVKLHPRRHDSPPNAEAPVHRLNTSVCRFLYDRAVDVSLASWLVDGNPADDQDGQRAASPQTCPAGSVSNLAAYKAKSIAHLPHSSILLTHLHLSHHMQSTCTPRLMQPVRRLISRSRTLCPNP